jgi:hypothetical protein
MCQKNYLKKQVEISQGKRFSIPGAVTSGILGTLVMTLFSYISPLFSIPKMRELDYLNILISKDNESHIHTAWAVHNLVGVTFSMVYALLWTFGIGKPDLKNGTVLGALSGLLGTAVWKTVIKTDKSLPRLSTGHLSANLIPAHILFGITAAMVYKNFKGGKNGRYKKFE